MDSFSLVAEIGWLARVASECPAQPLGLFQSRCRDWVVGEPESSAEGKAIGIVSVSLPRLGGWRVMTWLCLMPSPASFSLVAEIGWLARIGAPMATALRRGFSLVAEIGWLASAPVLCHSSALGWFQSRCRDWVVGEPQTNPSAQGLPIRFSLVAEIGWLARGCL